MRAWARTRKYKAEQGGTNRDVVFVHREASATSLGAGNEGHTPDPPQQDPTALPVLWMWMWSLSATLLSKEETMRASNVEEERWGEGGSGRGKVAEGGRRRGLMHGVGQGAQKRARPPALAGVPLEVGACVRTPDGCRTPRERPLEDGAVVGASVRRGGLANELQHFQGFGDSRPRGLANHGLKPNA